MFTQNLALDTFLPWHAHVHLTDHACPHCGHPSRLFHKMLCDISVVLQQFYLLEEDLTDHLYLFTLVKIDPS